MQAPQTSVRNAPVHAAWALLTDIELVERAAGGDEAAFESVMRRHNRMLFRTARSIVKHDAEAEEVLQDAYLRAWRSLGSFRAESRLSTWLMRIVINEALGRLRRRRVEMLPLSSVTESTDADTQEFLRDDRGQGPEHAAMRGQVRRLMEACIDTLPEAFRTVFMLRAVEELSVEEISAALRIPPGTVRTRYFRARGLLREGLSRDSDLTVSEAFSFDGGRCDRIVAAVLAAHSEDVFHPHHLVQRRLPCPSC